MKVKKFNAVDNHDAMRQVRQELGIDAVILHQRKVRPKGLFGFMKKPLIEVVAAVEEYPIPQPVSRSQSELPFQSKLQSELHLQQQSRLHPESQVKPQTKLPPHAQAQLKAQPQQGQEQEVKPIEANLRAKMERRTAGYQQPGELSKEILEIKSMLATVVGRVNREQMPLALQSLNQADLELIYGQLKAQEIEEPVLDEIIQELAAFVKELGPATITREMILDKLNAILVPYVNTQESHQARVIFFVGPTGVGKTTTIAKLAAQFSIHEGKQVGFISADTYRIAAVEQLKTYSEILDIPLEVIYEPKEIQLALERLKHKDLVLVDTAGRSHRNEKQMKELQLLLDQVDEKEIYLVISCTSKNQDVKEILSHYDFLEQYKFIFTKLDEATTYGTILNTTVHTQRPVSYVTVGQSVPDDIQMVDVKQVIRLLMKEV